MTYPSRNSMISTIYVAKKQLSIEEDAYRGLLKRVTGYDSLKSCSIKDLHNIIADLKTKGFKIKPKITKSVPVSTDKFYKDPRDKALSLWLALYEIGAVRNSSDASLSAYCAKVAKVDHWHWMDRKACYVVIEQLKIWLNRTKLLKLAEALHQSGKIKAKLSNADLLDLVVATYNKYNRAKPTCIKSINMISSAIAEFGINHLANAYAIIDVTKFIKEARNGGD